MRSSGKHIAAVLVLVLSGAWVAVHAQTPASLRYEALSEQERRVAMSPAAVAEDFRIVVNRYWNFVRRYPANGYVDNALWQAATFSMDAFARFGEARDKHRAIQLFQWLRDHYPHSPFSARAAAQIEHLASTQVHEETEPAAPPPGRPPQPATAETTIRAVQRQVLPDVVRVTIELDREVSFHQERLESPARLFFDLKGTRTVPPLVDAVLRFETDVVRHIRLGRHPNNTTRVVLDLENVDRYKVFTLYKPYRIVIDSDRPRLQGAGSSAAATPLARAVSVMPVVPFARITPSVPILVGSLPASPSNDTAAAAKPNAVPAPRIPVTRTPPIPPPPPSVNSAPLPAPPAPEAPGVPIVPGRPVTPSANSGGSFSVARQLGLGISRVVIDAGHGGHDPGASAFGVTEAEVVLDIALRLEQLLLQQPGMEVVLTRRTDEFLSLDERTQIANRESADLFLSIHANASASAVVRGVETYFLNFALNPQAEAVAARENAASGKNMNSLSGIVKAITLNSKLNESRDFASSVQRALARGLRPSNPSLKDLGVKQAPFMVLIGASMPSVLAEISFVTNRQEARLLKSSAYRQKIAESLLTGILKYQQSLKKVQTAVQSKDAGAVLADNRQGR
jgi:N-acetylmuramoyl-L-alanine amidase